MSINRLQARAPSAKFVTVAILYEHELRFHKISNDGSGKCDAYKTNDESDLVIGVIYAIAESEKQDLDRKEGLGYGYEEKMVELIVDSGETIKATTYYATNIGTGLNPYIWYTHHVLTGARENRLPNEYVKKIENVESIFDPKPERHEKEMAIHANKLLRKKYSLSIDCSGGLPARPYSA
jgi:hypothetical protein